MKFQEKLRIDPVTPNGIVLPKGTKYEIPKRYVESPYGRTGSYGEIVNDLRRWERKVRIIHIITKTENGLITVRDQVTGIRDFNMKNEFNNLNWHDAELQSIHVDRSDPGKKDQVVLVIYWPNKRKSEIVFHDCYVFEAQMNFGIIAEETIRDAEYTENSEKLNEIRRSWEKIGADLSGLGQYRIETNSTFSSLIIYARGVWIKDI